MVSPGPRIEVDGQVQGNIVVGDHNLAVSAIHSVAQRRRGLKRIGQPHRRRIVGAGETVRRTRFSREQGSIVLAWS